MARFQLTLRDAFIVTTIFCFQFALSALYFQLPEEFRTWLTSGLIGTTTIGVPIAVAIVVADVKRRLPLLSGVIAFVAFFTLCYASMQNDFLYLIAYSTESSIDNSLYGLLQWNFALSLALVCGWLTRSLMPRPG